MPPPTEPSSIADARIGVVDLGQVLALSRDGKAMMARIDTVRAKLQTELDARGKEVLTLETRLAQAELSQHDVATMRAVGRLLLVIVERDRDLPDAAVNVAL
jgi:Skp family chaperone for outer membrane proteins